MIRTDTDDLIAFLNELTLVDPHAMAELLMTRVPCNKEMADHRSVQVVGAGEGFTFIAPGTFRVGVLGLLNGYCGTIESDGGPHDRWGPITAVYEDGKLVGFVRTTEP